MTKISKKLMMAICIIVLLLSFYNAVIFMSLEPYSPFVYEPDRFQFIVPGTIIFFLFLCLILLIKILRYWLYFPSNVGKIILFLLILGAIPTWANLSNLFLFFYVFLYGIIATLLSIYLLFLPFKNSNIEIQLIK